MRVIRTYLLGLIVLVVFGCTDDDNGINSNGDDVLIPLELGNRWNGIQKIYATDGETVIDEFSFDYHVFDDVNTSSETWFSIRYIIRDSIFDPRLVYINKSNGVWEQSPCGNLVCRVELWGMYPAFPGDSFYVNHVDYHEIMVDLDSVNIDDLETVYDFALVVSTDTNITVPAGTFTCYCYKWTPNIAMAANTIYFHISPNFGFVKKEEYDPFSNKLVESWELENIVAN